MYACRFQSRYNASSSQLKGFLDLLKGELGPLLNIDAELPSTVGVADKALSHQAGVEVVQLHGCTGCHQHVWLESDQGQKCPRCGAGRLDSETKKPKEVVYHFPLAARLQALLRTPAYTTSIGHERARKRSPLSYSDVYDTPAWEQTMGALGTFHTHTYNTTPQPRSDVYLV